MGEHSVQIQLPLLQRTFGDDFLFVPVVVGQLDVPTQRRVAAALMPLLDDETLVVVSSDFTHYGTGFSYVPFRGEDIRQQIDDLDHRVFERVVAKDLPGFWEVIEQTGATVCGRSALGVLLGLLPDAATIEEVAYDTSGRQTGDRDQSVSYLSAIVRVVWSAVDAGKTAEGRLTPAECAALLRLAHVTVDRVVRGRPAPTAEELGVEMTPGLMQTMGGFVTLHQRGQLRGCIGEIEPRRSIWEVVTEQAENAALHDYRFGPVTPVEVGELSIEISAMTPPVAIGSWSEFVVGKHGIVLSKAGRSAVFLPQVAPEQGWTAEQTLTHLAQKAGLDPDAWREGAEFEVFEAQVFNEE